MTGALVLFDVDGTLLGTDGAGRTALQRALVEVFGTTGPIDGYHFHGKTDPQIVFELLGAAGVARDRIRGAIPDLWRVYLKALGEQLELKRQKGLVGPMPGIPDLLSQLETRGAFLGLLTGNLEAGARLKLAAAGLSTRFSVGGYGSDSPVRTEIARIVIGRARRMLGSTLDGMPVVVVGDTPADVECARALAARSVTVATGRHSREELLASGADAAFEDFRDTGASLAAVLESHDGV